MSTGILLTGKRGQGKTLASVGRIREYLVEGRRIATNLDLYLDNMLRIDARNVDVYRLPDYPTHRDLLNLPLGNAKLFYREDGSIGYLDGYTDENNGLLCLDEVASFLNARDWNDKDKKAQRDAINDWLRHSRKYGWDILMLAQHEDLIDKQTRSALFEMWGICKRLDRLSIPFFTWLFKQFDIKLRPPKVHIAIIRYGMSELSPISDRWMYRGHDLYRAYDTNQVLGNSNVAGVATMLTPWHLKGRYLSKLERFVMYARVALVSALAGLLIGGFVTHYYGRLITKSGNPTMQSGVAAQPVETLSAVRLLGTFNQDGRMVATLSNGAILPVQTLRELPNETRVSIAGVWYSNTPTSEAPKP